jgi:pyruvate dehydrogenase E2 component (dihydrolipoamide acetyltransferase)
VAQVTLTIPDLGGAHDVTVIEVLVQSGETIQLDDPIMTLEGDKATMEIPATQAGTIATIQVKVGDKVNEGDPILTLTPQNTNAPASPEPPTQQPSQTQPEPAPQAATNALQTLVLPDLGSPDAVTVIDIAIKPGDTIQVEQPVLTLEGDKASMDIPAPASGVVQTVLLKVNDTVTSATPFATIIPQTSSAPTTAALPPPVATIPIPPPMIASALPTAPINEPPPVPDDTQADQYAGPGARRLARALGITLTTIQGSGHKGRITSRDVEAHVKNKLIVTANQNPQGSFAHIKPQKAIDFNRFGEFEQQPLSKIQQSSGEHLHRNWVTIPHVTQHGDADITNINAYRQKHKQTALEHGIKLTPLVFIMKAVVAVLKAFPRVNSSLDQTGQNLIIKHYYHLGVAVDTPHGLVVPVIKNVDQKNIIQLAQELSDFSAQARQGKLTPAQMQGSCFTISSLGGIGGHYFTPIINAPDVAILGVSKASMKPVYDPEKKTFSARLHLPLSLSYDHRVIDGAEGARFFVALCQQLSDFESMTFNDMLQTTKRPNSDNQE